MLGRVKLGGSPGSRSRKSGCIVVVGSRGPLLLRIGFLCVLGRRLAATVFVTVTLLLFDRIA